MRIRNYFLADPDPSFYSKADLGPSFSAELRSRVTTFRVEPEPIFLLARAGADFFKAAPAPAASFDTQKRKALLWWQNMT